MPAVTSNAEEIDSRLPALLATMTASERLFELYLIQARHYLYARKIVQRREGRAEDDPFRSASLRESALYKRPYLVMAADDAWVTDVSDGADAITIPGRAPMVGRPAAAVIKWSETRLRNRQFQSVLEHEFVHVNQHLLGVFPEVATSEETLLSEFEGRVQCEHAAYFIQRMHHRELTQYGFSVDEWVALRAVPGCVETLLHRALSLSLSGPVVVDTLRRARESILAGTIAHESAVVWMRGCFTSIVARAAGIVAERSRDLPGARVLEEVSRWAGPPEVLFPMRLEVGREHEVGPCR